MPTSWPAGPFAALFIASSAGVAGATTASSADFAPPPQATASPRVDASPSTFSLKLGARGDYQFESDLDDGPGSVSVARAGANAALGFGVGDRSRLNIVWDSEFSWYDWQKPDKFSKSAKDPWTDTLQHTLGAQLFVPETDNWAWFVGGGVRASFEREASFSDSLTYVGQGGARYKFSDAFALSFGAAVATRLEDDASILPIIGINWKISDKLSLSTERGAGVQLRYDASDAIALVFDAGYESREFRLRDDGTAPKGVGIDRRIPVTAGIIWTIAPTCSISAKGGLVAWSKYKLEDQNGLRISETDADPAGFISLGVDFKF